MCDRAQFANKVIALDVIDKAVRVGETETQTIAERRQQAIAIELVHNELRKFEYEQPTAIGFERTAFVRRFSTIARSVLMIDECL